MPCARTFFRRLFHHEKRGLEVRNFLTFPNSLETFRKSNKFSLVFHSVLRCRHIVPPPVLKLHSKATHHQGLWGSFKCQIVSFLQFKIFLPEKIVNLKGLYCGKILSLLMCLLRHLQLLLSSTLYLFILHTFLLRHDFLWWFYKSCKMNFWEITTFIDDFRIYF